MYVATPAVVVAAVAWLLKVVVQESLRRESDRLRAGVETQSALALEQVRQEAARQMEILRHEFDMVLEEHKVKFAHLQDRRVDLIVGLYGALSKVAMSVTSTEVAFDLYEPPEWAKEAEQVEKACDQAEDAYHAALLYLPKAITDRVNGLIQVARNAAMMYYITVADVASGTPEAGRDAFKRILTVQPGPELNEIGSAFRTLLGVEAGAPENR